MSRSVSSRASTGAIRAVSSDRSCVGPVPTQGLRTTAATLADAPGGWLHTGLSHHHLAVDDQLAQPDAGLKVALLHATGE